MLAHDECQVCLQVQHFKSQSFPVDDMPHGQTVLLVGFFFLVSEDLLVSLSENGESVVANGLSGL
jgi:hypothetical protein